jgi:predicted Zn-dependent peptidase
MKTFAKLILAAMLAVSFFSTASAQVYSSHITTWKERWAAGKFAAEHPDQVFQVSNTSETIVPARPEKISFPALSYEPPNAADFRVQLKSGPVAYVVPDRELPLVNITVYIRTGQYLEPAGKEGLAELTGWLLAHGGAGTNTAEQLEERLAFLAADLSADIGDTQGSVSLNLLSKDLDEGLGILRDVLYAPRFQDDKIKLRKEQLLQEMKQRNDDSANIEATEKARLAFGENFWLNHLATAASLNSINRYDIDLFRFQWIRPKNFIIAVSGDFDHDEMVGKLEKLFAGEPRGVSVHSLFHDGTPPPIPTNTTFAAPGVYLVNKPDVNQGRVSMMLPGIQRDNPDLYAVTVMNDILGGGGFTSRILNHVRSDEGLAYSAGSRFPGAVYFPGTFTALFQSKSRTVPYAASIVLDEIKKIAAAPVTDGELNIAKRAFIERFPRNFATKKQAAAALAQEEFTGRYATDPSFYKNYRTKIAAVTAADVQRVAQKYLTPEKLVILIVGKKDDILLGHPNHPTKLSDLGAVKDLPLRDPLTLKPLAK